MTFRLGTIRKTEFFRIISIIILINFSLTVLIPNSYAQIASLPASELGLATAFVPPLLKGIKVDLNKPFNFDFVLDTGSNRQQTTANGLKDESTKLIKYFLASLAIPEKDLWVNLNPKEPDRIVPNEFGQTEMGRDLLAQDYILKQIAASLMNPEGEVGKVFWKKIYKQAYEKFGTTDVPVDALNKVWIVPEKAVVYENPSTEPGQATAFVVEAKLKVLLEEEYLKTNDKRPMTKDQPLAGKKSLVSGLRSSVSDLIRSVIIPVLEKEVNESEHFAQLRQVYYSLILAKWYKETLKESILNKKYSDQKKVTGVDILNKNEKEKIYQQYLETFRKGVVNYIKEEYDPVTKSLVPRKYFSGGGDFTNLQLSKVTDLAMVSKLATLGAMLLLISGILLSPNNKILEVKNSNAIKMEDNLKPTSINNVNISKLTQYINQNFGIIGGVEESQIRRSLEISNLPEYQDFVAATYKILEKIGIKDKVPILFLEGYDNPNMAFALQEAGIIMVGAGIFKNLTLQEKIALLAPKIAHEAVHIQYPHLSILEQEALAYEKTAEALDLFNGEPGIITITENISRAFRAIVDNPSEILRTLRAKSLGPINYDDISIQGSEGTIKLYNMVNKKRMDFKFNTGLVKKMDSVSDSKDNAMKTDELEILSPQEAREYIYINFSEELSKNQQRALSEEKALIENVRLMPNQRSIILSKQHIHVPTLHYAVTDAKQQNPILVSTGANPCFIVIIWDKEKKIGFLAHLHYLSKPTDFINFALEKMQSRLDSQSIDKADLEVTLIGGRSNNVPNKHRLNKEFINQGIFNVKDMGDIEEGSTRVVYTGALDPRTGEIFNVLQPLHKMVVPEKSPESKLIPFDLTDVRGLGGDQAMMTEQEAREVINHIENVLIHQMIRKPAEDVLKILNELKELLIKIKAFPDPIYDDNYSDLKGYKISYLEKSIAEQEKAVLFELLVKNISKQNGRPFLDITAWQASPFVSAEGEKLDSGDLVGHATNFETIYNIIFESSGVIRAQGDEPIYVGGHGQGQSARVRILHKPGLIHIVWSQDSLAKENIYRRKSLGEITFDQDMPLRLAIAPSKCHIWQSMLSILEAKNEELTFEKKQKIAFALGYDRYDALVSELTPFIDNVFKISSVDVADKAIVGKEQAPGGIDLNPDKFQIEKKGDGVEFNWPTDPKALENIQINGLVPVIINITPIDNLPMFLGMVDSSAQIEKNSRI